jgi:hypothetical protein
VSPIARIYSTPKETSDVAKDVKPAEHLKEIIYRCWLIYRNELKLFVWAYNVLSANKMNINSDERKNPVSFVWHCRVQLFLVIVYTNAMLSRLTQMHSKRLSKTRKLSHIWKHVLFGYWDSHTQKYPPTCLIHAKKI